MKLTTLAFVLCGIFALGAAFPPDLNDLAEAQWHLRAPERGCVEVRHAVGGSTFRTYACDGLNGQCIFTPHVNRCPTSALFHKPNFERVVNIRSRDHLVRYYNQIGGACVLSLLPECCSKASEGIEQAEDECRHKKLPTGEIIDDPVGCYTKPSTSTVDTMDQVNTPRTHRSLRPHGTALSQGQGDVRYELTGTFRFVEDSDEFSDRNNNYEPYGSLKIKVDHFGFSYTVWDIPRESHGSIPLRQEYSTTVDISFNESTDFASNGQITLLGSVKEADQNPSRDDIIGSYHNEVVQASDIYNKHWEKRFNGAIDGYVILELTMNKRC